eukprot:gene18736-20625_t
MKRNVEWKNDTVLKTALEGYSRENFKRTEMLSFLEKDFPQYAWSLRSLDRRLREFKINRVDKDVSVEQLRNAVQEELDGPGRLLGYRAMCNKIRQKHQLKVPRRYVHAMMYELDPEGLADRSLVNKRKNRIKGKFTSRGTNWVLSLDGHCKLMGYMKSTFPLAVYGCMDTASRKLLFLRIGAGNSDPRVIGRWYFEYLYESKMIASMLRLDKGTETGMMATIHAFLRNQHGDMDALDTVIYGKSTSNQIERWWRELHERLEKYYKVHLAFLKDQGHYDPDMDIDRAIGFHCFLLHVTGWPITDDELKEVAELSGVLEHEDQYLPVDIENQFKQIIADPKGIKPNDCVDAYLYLKHEYERISE